MDIVGDRKFVEVPGEKTHELPPLLVRTSPNVKRLDRVVGMANNLIDADDMIPLPPMEGLAQEHEADRRKMDLAINLVDQYLRFITQWQWGDSILEWIRQCETTFGTRLELRNLLRPDVWPHAGRSSFVTLLEDKAVPNEGDRIRKSGRSAADFSPAAAHFLFLEPVLVLFERQRGDYGLSDLGAHDAGADFVACRRSDSLSTLSTCRLAAKAKSRSR